MCTILILQRVHPAWPLVLATNRDELYARPTAGPMRLLSAPPTVGGRDLRAGGTWMGVTADGLFVGVTNQRGAAPPAPAPRSRGELVVQALRAGDREGVHALLERLDARAYESFNLLYGDADGLFVAYGRRERREVERRPVPDGLHVLPNGRLDSPDFPKVARARALLAPHVQADWPALREALVRTLADRQRSDPPPGAAAPFGPALMRELSALCVRTPRYGTRSATVVALRPGGVDHYLYADGPPDSAPFIDVTPLFEAPAPPG